MNRKQIDEALSKELVSVTEVCDILGLSKVTVIKMIGGKLEGVDISAGSKKANWRIRSGSVRKLLGLEEVATA